MPNEIVGKQKIGMKGFAGRVQKAAAESGVVTHEVTCKNRIALLLDNSGSMSSIDDYSSSTAKSKIELLKDAVNGFVNACDLSDTALCLYAIPVDPHTTVPMTQQSAMIILGSLHLDASGGTPLGASMKTLLESEALTRCMIVSDGDATDGYEYKHQANQFKLAEIPCDCLHIGSSTNGESTLKEIASITGGIFIKFKDVNQFARSIHYLTPRYAAMLGSATSEEMAKLLGANEVKK